MKYMNKKCNSYKKYIILFLLIYGITINAGCLRDSTSVNEGPNQDKLRINIFNDDYVAISAISEFNKSSKIKIIPTMIDIKSQNDIANYKTRLTTEILAGQGPDIIYDFPESFPSLWKIINSGAFYDLNKIIDNDKEFNLSEYNKEVLECGVINGKRYFIPIYFKIPVIWSASSILRNNKLMINDNGWNWDDFKVLSMKYADKQNIGNKYFIGNSFDFESIIKNCWTDYINYPEKEVNFDSEEFVKLLNNYKSIYQYILPDSKLKAPDIFFEFLKNDSLALVNGDNSIAYLWICSSWVNRVLDADMSCFLYPDKRNINEINAQVTKFAVINNNCKNKKEAFNFIKLLLSEKYQNNETGTKWAPVNIKAYTSIQNQYSGDSANNKQTANFLVNENTPYLSVALSNNTINKLNLYYKNIGQCSYVDTNILNIINQEVEAFLVGKHNAPQTAKIINDKVQLYMNE